MALALAVCGAFSTVVVRLERAAPGEAGVASTSAGLLTDDGIDVAARFVRSTDGATVRDVEVMRSPVPLEYVVTLTALSDRIVFAPNEIPWGRSIREQAGSWCWRRIDDLLAQLRFQRSGWDDVSARRETDLADA